MRGRTWLLNLLLASGVAWFAYSGYLFWTGPPGEAPAAPPDITAPRLVRPSLPELAPAPQLSHYQVIVERNLFTETRAPQREAVGAVAQQPPVPVELPQDRFVLYGVVRLGDNKYYAFIRDRKNPDSKVQTMAVGDALQPGQTIAEIGETSVRVTMAGGDAELRLRAPKGPEDTSFKPTPVSPMVPGAPASPAVQRRVPAAQATRPQPRSVRPRQSTAGRRGRQPAEARGDYWDDENADDDYSDDYYDSEYDDEYDSEDY